MENIKNTLQGLNEDLHNTSLEVNSILEEAAELLVNSTFTTRDNKKGVITSVDRVSENYSINYKAAIILSANLTSDTETVSKQFLINKALESGYVTFDDSQSLDNLNKIISSLNTVFATRENILDKIRQAENIEAKKKKEEEELKAKIEKAKIKAEQLKNSQLRAAENLKKKTSHYDGNDYYYSLGWIARHAKNFIAAMPDYLEHWFIELFGDVPHRAVDQTILSPCGLPSQYALYFKIDLDTNENIPAYLVNHLGNVKKEVKPLSDTQFIFDIMLNEGFVFGKAKDQNLDKILDQIPNQYLKDFHAGYKA